MQREVIWANAKKLNNQIDQIKEPTSGYLKLLFTESKKNRMKCFNERTNKANDLEKGGSPNLLQ